MLIPDYITHYYYPDKKPFLNLSDLQEEDRAHIIEDLNTREKQGNTLRAFPDWYMPQRLNAERRLQELFIQKGGNPERDAPHYFTLGYSPMLEWVYKHDFKTITFPVQEFQHTELCFSIGDNLWTMAESQNPEVRWNNRWFEGKVYNYAETCAIIRELELDVENMDSLKKHKLNYIEALVWTNKPLGTKY